MKIPKHHFSNNKLKLNNEVENKKIVAYNTNTANNNINLNNNIINNIRDNYHNIYNKDNARNLNRNAKLIESQEKLSSSSTNKEKIMKGLKKFSPKKDVNYTDIENNNTNRVLSVRKISKKKLNNFHAIKPKNYIINSRMVKKIDKNGIGSVVKTKTNFIKQ